MSKLKSNESSPLSDSNVERITDESIKMKRKKSTSSDSYVIESIDAIDYEIVQHENNKRQKVEISKGPETRSNDKENNTYNQPTNSEKPKIASNVGNVPQKPAKINTKNPFYGSSDKLRMKYENIHTTTVQKLTAQAEQLRSEIITLRTALANEQSTVRALRGRNDANFRKEKIQSSKGREGKPQYVNRNATAPNVSASANSQLNVERLLKEIDTLKETNKRLASQAQKTSKADRQKVTNIQQLKEEYEHRLGQTTKASKVEINRLLEEIKIKEKAIAVLQRNVSRDSLSSNKQHYATKKQQPHDKTNSSSAKMRKKETESCHASSTTMHNEHNKSRTATMTKTTTTENQNSPQNQTKQTNATHDSTTQTICKPDLFTMPQEIRDRIMNVQNELQFCKSKDLSGSDNDSGLSSAPPSLSPQPGTQSNSPDVWQTLVKDFKDQENLQKEYESVKEENQFLNCEISLAEEQIRELEKVLQMTRENNRTDELLERIHQLECKEAMMLKESHELREQNELLEFRIIELEEGGDKLLSANGDGSEKRDAWTCFGGVDCQPSNSAAIKSETSSPNSLYEINTIDQIPTDHVRRSLLAMAEHTCFDEQNRQCLLQVVSLLNNLEAMSNGEHDFLFDDESFVSITEKNSSESTCSNHIKLSSTSSNQSTPAKMLGHGMPYNNNNNNNNNNNQNTDEMISHKLVAPKLSSSHSFSSSMNESGVFDGDIPPSVHQSTQTTADDFSPAPNVVPVTSMASDLCAEIQKLNKFRKKIEECTLNMPSLDIGVMSPLSKLDETRLQYYRDRLELLENKVAIYETSGDVQIKKLALRLQNEIQLEAQTKRLQQRVEKLETINRQLDEERCELEEMENDTRLQSQRLEVELEMLSQRNSELEMSRETAQANFECLQETLDQSNEQIMALDAERCDLMQTLELINAFMPAILLYQAWRTQQHQQNAIIMQTQHDANIDDAPTLDDEFPAAFESETMPSAVIQRTCHCNKEHICPDGERFVELTHREQELTNTIADMNRAYNETLERADNLWAQMERDYKEKLNRSQEDNTLLRSKINQLEKRLKNDAHYAQERIAQLEDEENMLKRRLSKLNRISRDDADKYKSLQSDFQTLTNEYEKLKVYADGPLTEALDKERKKVRTIEEEMRMAAKMYNDLEQLHRTQMHSIKSKLDKSKKDLMQSEMNNTELKEEVVQLEHRIIELNRCRREDEDRLKALAAEAHEIQAVNKPIKPMRFKHHNSRNLAQELGSYGHRNNELNAINNLNYTSVYTLNSVSAKISDSIKNFDVNREPMRHQFE